MLSGFLWCLIDANSKLYSHESMSKSRFVFRFLIQPVQTGVRCLKPWITLTSNQKFQFFDLSFIDNVNNSVIETQSLIERNSFDLYLAITILKICVIQYNNMTSMNRWFTHFRSGFMFKVCNMQNKWWTNLSASASLCVCANAIEQSTIPIIAVLLNETIMFWTLDWKMSDEPFTVDGTVSTLPTKQ